MKSTSKTNKIFIDSSALIASLLADDALYKPASRLMEQLILTKRLFISSEVLAETLTRIKQKNTAQKAIEAIPIIKKLIAVRKLKISPTTLSIFTQASKIFSSHPTPKTFSFTDALIVAHMQELMIFTLFTFDRDFKNLGVKIVP